MKGRRGTVAKKVLILSYSDIKTDPRVLRQIRVLRKHFKCEIGVIGCGESLPSLEFYRVPVAGLLRRYLGYFIRNNELRQKYFFGKYISDDIVKKFNAADLVIANEIEFLPLVLHYIRENQALYVDLHEHHLGGVHSGILEKFAFAKFRRWQLEHLRILAERRRVLLVSSVSDEIASFYSSWLDDVSVATILNSSGKSVEVPSENLPSNRSRLRLMHHGMGRKNRGIELMVRTLPHLPKSMDLHLVLRTSWIYKLKIQVLARVLGVHDRLIFEAPVAYEHLILKLQEFDVSIVPGSDKTQHDLFALPNKLFESIQARLPLVVGPNPSVSKIVGGHGIGEVARSWTVAAFSAAILELAGKLEHGDYSDALMRASIELSADAEETKLEGLLRQVIPSPLS